MSLHKLLEDFLACNLVKDAECVEPSDISAYFSEGSSPVGGILEFIFDLGFLVLEYFALKLEVT